MVIFEKYFTITGKAALQAAKRLKNNEGEIKIP
jgi:hypothetical protein